MTARPRVNEKTALALGAWAANSFAILVANLRNRELVSDEMVEHFQEGLRQLEEDLSSEAYEAVDHIDYILEGEWIKSETKPT